MAIVKEAMAATLSPPVSNRLTVAIVLAALAAAAGVVAIVLSSDNEDVGTVFAVFWPTVGCSFVGTGLYAWRARPENRTGALMVLLGFAWMLSSLQY
jgi:peptidoglycan/LPS O-acetylase OafA/YrhL